MHKKIRNKLLSILLAIAITAGAAVPCAALPAVQPQSLWVVASVLGNTLNQFLTGNASGEEITRIFASLPVLPDDGAHTQDVWDMLRGMWISGIRDGTIVLKETAEEDVYQLGLTYNNLLRREKQVFDFRGTIEYNAKTGFFQGEDGRGVFGIGFDYDALQHMVRPSSNSWLQKLGYNEFYDAMAPLLGVLIDTLRFPFSYDGWDWMVQLWKGTYFAAFHGAEVGLYRKPQDRRVDHYDSAGMDLPLSLKVYHDDNLLFSTGEHDSWWIAGFQYGNPFVSIYPAAKLWVEGSVQFADKGMLDAFYGVFDKLKPAGITGGRDGLTFNFIWGKENL